MTPCVSTPLRFAQTSTSATTAASASGMPVRAKTSVAKRLSASAGAVGAWAAGARGSLMQVSELRGEVFAEPIAHEGDHQSVFLREHEMIDVGYEMEIGRLARALEKLYRLLGRRHRVVRRMKQKQRPRRDPPHDLVRVETVHALDDLEGKFHDRARREVAAQARRNGNDVVARHAHRFSGALAAFSFFHHRGELLPGPGRGVLLAEFLRAVAPAARGNAGGDPSVDPRRVYGDCGAKTLPDHGDALRVDLRPGSEERQRVPRVFDLLLADDAPALAFALAAAAAVEAQRRVAEPGEHFRDRRTAAAVLVAAESVQDKKGGAPGARSARLGRVQNARELQSVRYEADPFFHFPDSPVSRSDEL